MANQFATLAEAETDEGRLAYYSSDIQALAPRVTRMCNRETTRRLGQILADRFPAKTLQGDEDSPD
jgi:hypothetical protein